MPRSARAPLRPSILPAPLRRDAQSPRHCFLGRDPMLPPLRLEAGGRFLLFPSPPSLVLARPAPLLGCHQRELPCLVPKAEDVRREAGVAAFEAKRGGGLCGPQMPCSAYVEAPSYFFRLDCHLTFNPFVSACWWQGQGQVSFDLFGAWGGFPFRFGFFFYF